METTGKTSYLKGSEPLLHYLVRPPKVKTSHPRLLILLHGVGSNENDLFSFADQLPADMLVVSARAPYVLAPGSYAWYQVDMSSGKPVINAEQAEKSRTIIVQFINQLKELHDLDTDRVFLCGFSQGAIMSYSVALTRPDKVKGIAVMSGRLLDEVKPAIASSDKLKGLEVFISHGTRDNVLDIHYARESVVFLKSLGIVPEYREYDEVHSIDQQMLHDMIHWLNSK